jgi:hypothetical protein
MDKVIGQLEAIFNGDVSETELWDLAIEARFSNATQQAPF